MCLYVNKRGVARVKYFATNDVERCSANKAPMNFLKHIYLKIFIKTFIAQFSKFRF